jgi:hypothetical protein
VNNSLTIDAQNLVKMFREYEADCNKRPDADEGARAFQFCAIALEEMLRHHGVHIGQTIECELVISPHIIES